jgi:hypothetical protein
MTTEDRLKLEMRLAALEFVVCKIAAGVLIASGQTGEKLAKAHEEQMRDVAKQMFPVNDPALSDLATAEWEEAIGRLLKMQRSLVAQAMGTKGS